MHVQVMQDQEELVEPTERDQGWCKIKSVEVSEEIIKKKKILNATIPNTHDWMSDLEK